MDTNEKKHMHINGSFVINPILSDLAILCKLVLQHLDPFSANWAFACKTETLGSLYSDALSSQFLKVKKSSGT